MLPALPAPGPVAEGDDSPTLLYPEVANDVPESGPQARAPGPEDPASFDLVYAVARAHLPGSLRLWGVPPEDIDDLVQDAAMIASEGLPHFTPRCGSTPDLHRSLR